MKALKNWFSRRGALPLTAYLLALAVWLTLRQMKQEEKS